MTEKITKLCWNEFKWVKPSGSHGKSKVKKTHESEFGYGHDEWLLDKSKVIDGYHYGFIQPFNLKSDIHIGKLYKLWLYSFTDKEKLILGNIKKCERISEDHSIEIYKKYKSKGWFDEMVKDLEDAGINPSSFKKTPSNIFFNIRFKINDVDLFDDYLTLSSKDKNINIGRYILLSKNSDFIYKPNSLIKRKGIAPTFINPYHKSIQKVLVKLLMEDSKYSQVKKEFEYVDVQGIFNSRETHFFEIKTDTPKNNIRQAIGQLLEYSFFPQDSRAHKLVIIGDKMPERNVLNYLSTLRTITSLNLYYRWIDMEQNLISEEY